MMNIKRCYSDKNYGIDRIGSLPDDVLTDILSFLSTRKAVQTCILSKRWKNTWASVPVLEFDIKEFGLPKIVDDEMAVEFVTKFELLVKSVLEKRETSCVIKRFRFWLGSGVYWPRTQAVVDCIGDAMKLKPRECSVKLNSCANLNLNIDMIFTCASLIDLQLRFPIDVHPFVAIEPNLVNLPCLKTLELTGRVTINEDFLEKLLLGCPVLEELLLSCHMGIIEIYSNTLKKLVIRGLYEGERLQITTPNLLYFVIYIMDMGEILLLNMPSLVDVSIYIPGWYDQDEHITGVPKLIASFSNLESLKLEFLCCDEEEVLKKEFSNCPVFNNLKRLELASCNIYVFDLAPFFLHHSPKLQELTFKNIFTFLYEETALEGPRDALVQREFLKTVRVVGFKNNNGFVDRLINKLFAHVKIIGEIILETAKEAALQAQSLCPPLPQNAVPPQQSLQVPQQYPQQSGQVAPGYSQVAPSYNQTIYGYQGGVADPSTGFSAGASEAGYWQIMPAFQAGFVQEQPVSQGGFNQGTVQPASAGPTAQQSLPLQPQQTYRAAMDSSWDQRAPFAGNQQPLGYGAPNPYWQNAVPPQQSLQVPPPLQLYGQQATQPGFQQQTYSAMYPQGQVLGGTYGSVAAQQQNPYALGQYGQAYSQATEAVGYGQVAPSQVAPAYNQTIFEYPSTGFSGGNSQASYWQMIPATQAGFVQEQPVSQGGSDQGRVQPAAAGPTTQQSLQAPPPQQLYGQQVAQPGFQEQTYGAMYPQWQVPGGTYGSYWQMMPATQAGFVQEQPVSQGGSDQGTVQPAVTGPTTQQSLQAPPPQQLYGQQVAQPGFQEQTYGAMYPQWHVPGGTYGSYWQMMPATQAGFVQEQPVSQGGSDQGTVQPAVTGPTTQQSLQAPPPQQLYGQQVSQPGFQEQTYGAMYPQWQVPGGTYGSYWQVMPATQAGFVQEQPMSQGGYDQGTVLPTVAGPTTQQSLQAPPPQQLYGQQVAQPGFQEQTYGAMYPQWQVPGGTYESGVALGQYGQGYSDESGQVASGYGQVAPAYNQTVYGFQGNVADPSTGFSAGTSQASYWQMMPATKAGFVQEQPLNQGGSDQGTVQQTAAGPTTQASGAQ